METKIKSMVSTLTSYVLKNTLALKYWSASSITSMPSAGKIGAGPLYLVCKGSRARFPIFVDGTGSVEW